MAATKAETPDYEAIKSGQQATWATGHYSRIGSMLQICGERLAETMDARPGASFLDVAAGNGNLTLAAARRYTKVVSTDYVASLLDDGRSRAEANGFEVDFRTEDAEALSFDDSSFDYVGSTFGVMFAPDQKRAAAELLRVCKPGGKIGMANWTPEGFVGQMFKRIARFNPPPAGVPSPARWGTREFLDTHFGREAASIVATPRNFTFRFASADHFLQVFKSFFGPIIKALEAQTPEGRQALEESLVDLLDSSNVDTNGTLNIPGEYLEIVITRKSPAALP